MLGKVLLVVMVVLEVVMLEKVVVECWRRW